MDASNHGEIDEKQQDDNGFIDAQDDFPFYDCTDTNESELKVSPVLRPGLRRRIKAGEVSDERDRGSDSVSSFRKSSGRVNSNSDRVDSVRVAERLSRDEGENSAVTVASDEPVRESKELTTSDRESEVFVEESGRVGDSVDSNPSDQKIEEKAHRADGSVANEWKNEVSAMENEQVDRLTGSANSVQTHSNHRRRSFARLAGKSTRPSSQYSSTDLADSAVKTEDSTITTEDKDRAGDSVDSVSNSGNEIHAPNSSSFLLTLAEFVIKAIWFQLNLLITFIRLPIWFTYTCINFIFNPFSVINEGKNYFYGKLHSIWQLICKILNPLLYGWLKEHKSLWNIVFRYGWGLFWAVYVGFILCGLLLSASLMGAVVMRYLVVEPIKIEEKLNFDYTKHSPVACVPVVSCGSVECGAMSKGMVVEEGTKGKLRVIPEKHKLEASVSLVLPESQYNRNLGVFQVRVEFLSITGDVLSSTGHPCMLRFKSEPIQLLLTVLKIAPLVAGYLSESQTINVKFRGFTESEVPTACVRVIIEQRAEFQPGAGIPEIYDASFVLESGLSFLRRVLWCWKKTVYVWISMLLFTMEMLFILVCCRPIIIPKMRRRDNSASSSASQHYPPAEA